MLISSIEKHSETYSQFLLLLSLIIMAETIKNFVFVFMFLRQSEL